MLAGLLDEAMLAPADGGWRFDASATARVPATYAAWTAHRLASRGPAVAAVLRAAAVLGRDFDATLLAPMTGVDAATVAAALRAGVRMQLLGPVPGAPDRLRFRHALGRDAVHGVAAARPNGPGSPRRGWTQSRPRIRACRRRGASWRRGWPSPPGGGSRAAGLLVVAGRAAAGRGALAAAVGLLDEAVGQAAGDLDATAAAEEALVDALALAGDAQRALERRVPAAAHPGSG